MSREENVEMMRLQIRVIDADRMAAIVDEMVRGRQLDARSKLADARLDYGKPFDPEGMRQGAEMLESTRTRADCWLEGGRDDANRDTAVLSVEQAANAWKNAAYALAEKLAKTTPPEAVPREPTEAMCGEGALALGRWYDEGGDLHNGAREIYKAMVSAVSPQQKNSESPRVGAGQEGIE